MKQLRKHPLFLLAIVLTLPFGVAYLYYDYYNDNDLVFHTQISMADNGDLLSILRKTPKAVVAAEETLESFNLNSIETNSFHLINPVSTLQSSSVLRC